VQGTATYTTQLLGHEQVTVPVGTYLAAHMESRKLISTTIVIEADGKTYRGTLSGSETTNWWCVPEIGAAACGDNPSQSFTSCAELEGLMEKEK